MLATFEVTSAEALTGGTFAGLVFGLTLQPVLENFFAGILIISSGFNSIGGHIRILNFQIPYMTANLPPFKYDGIPLVTLMPNVATSLTIKNAKNKNVWAS